MTEYVTTREQCRENIGDRVCSGCGGPLEPIETVDNARNPTYWAGCTACSRFDNGVGQKIFQAARTLVTEYCFRPYSHMDRDEPGYIEAQTQGTTSMVLSVLHVARELGLLSHTGK